jgi:hypothetical protein
VAPPDGTVLRERQHVTPPSMSTHRRPSQRGEPKPARGRPLGWNVDGLYIADPTNATEPSNVRVYAVLNGS